MAEQTTPHTPRYHVTENYFDALRAIEDGELSTALTLLSQEPPTSPCHVLALINLALVLLRLGRAMDAESAARVALREVDRKGCPHAPSKIQLIRTLGDAMATQGKSVEALAVFNSAAHVADELINAVPDEATFCEIEKGHVFVSWALAHAFLRNPAVSVELLETARNLYRKHQAQQPPGQIESLITLGTSLRLLGQPTKAQFALLEARDLAMARSLDDLIHQANVALAQLGSDESTLDQVAEAARAAEVQGRFTVAHVRRCIEADVALAGGDTERARRAVTAARALEEELDANDLNRVKLHFTEARLLEASGAAARDVLRCLRRGAHLWFDRLTRRLGAGDIAALTTELHEHFRFLAGSLLASGATSEALVAFEAGRALAHSVEVDPSILGRLTGRNVFAEDGGSTSMAPLEAVQSTLDDDVAISITILPPQLVAFVVTRDGVRVVTEPLPSNRGELADLQVQLHTLPVRLQEGAGARAVPAIINALATSVASELGERNIRALLPYAAMHNVPWRAVLRSVGVPWEQLAASTVLGSLFTVSANVDISLDTCTALGFGTAGAAPWTIDLADEARAFARVLGAESTVVAPCDEDDVRRALRGSGVVLVSCHGEVTDRGDTNELHLELHDPRKTTKVVPFAHVLPSQIGASVVILSACDSGVYRMAQADYPVGAAPQVLRAGASYCVGARFKLPARFSANYFAKLAARLPPGSDLRHAMASACEAAETEGASLWDEIACLELMSSGLAAVQARRPNDR